MLTSATKHMSVLFSSQLFIHIYMCSVCWYRWCSALQHGTHIWLKQGNKLKKKKKHPLMSCCHCDSGWITRHHSPLWKLHLFRRRAREKWDWVLSPQCVSVRTITTCNTRRLTVFCCLTFSFYTNLLPDASTTPVCLNPFLSLPEFAA